MVQVSLVGGFVRGGGDTDFKATMIGFDENKDIAVLKIEVPDKKVRVCEGHDNISLSDIWFYIRILAGWL